MLSLLSYRRILLDKDLEEAKTYMKGITLDVGGGRKRGYFKEPDDTIWIVIDIDRVHQPHILADAQNIPVKSNTVDCVKCTELLEHAEYPERVLDEISRVLKPGGALILSVPFIAGVHADPYDFQRFTDEKLRRVLDRVNLRIVTLRKQGLFFTVLGYMLKPAILNAKSSLKYFFFWLLPILDLMVKLDDFAFVKNSKFMSSFTTGFFIIAREKESNK